MNRLYRISALALAAALCLALAACGPKLPGTNSGSSSAVSTPAASGSGSVSGSASVSSGGAGDTMSEGQRYAYAIRDARPAEDNEYSEIACGDAAIPIYRPWARRTTNIFPIRRVQRKR